MHYIGLANLSQIFKNILKITLEQESDRMKELVVNSESV